jgi:hypothetical protein
MPSCPEGMREREEEDQKEPFRACLLQNWGFSSAVATEETSLGQDENSLAKTRFRKYDTGLSKKNLLSS